MKRILRGYQREETSRFIAFRSHWRYQGKLCNPARGNEKGGVEGEGGYFRRNHWVPLPEARDPEELNAYVEQCCERDPIRWLANVPMSIYWKPWDIDTRSIGKLDWQNM